jgi:peptide chain release factor 2
MAGTDPADEIAALTSTLDSIEAVLDPGEMQREAADLRVQAADPELWTDPDRAQKVTRRLSYLEADLARLAGLRQRLADTQVLFDLAERENDEPTKQEAAGELAALRAEIDQLEVRTLLNGEYDAREALISINAQAGGADAADFAENLLRMYLRCGRHSTRPRLRHLLRRRGRDQVDHVRGERALLTDAARRHGTHRMVRISSTTTRDAARPRSAAST